MTTTPEFDPTHAALLKQTGENIASYNLPELPEADASEVYERISIREAQLASRGLTESGYDTGTASVDDQVFVLRGSASGLLTAEHATTHIRSGKRKDADWGTAGLGMVVHEDTDTSFVVAVGRQTGDANHDPEHPLKTEVQTIMGHERPLVIAGLHGMAAGKFADLEDTKPFDVFIGIGDAANERSEQLAEAVREIADDLGLRLGINQKFIRLDNAGRLAARKDGQPGIASNAFKAAGEHTTRAFAQRVAEDVGYEPALMQIELSSLFRRMPSGIEHDRHSREMGAYLGYLLVKRTVELGQSPNFAFEDASV